MNHNHREYEIERVNRVENTKSALAGAVIGGLLTAGAMLLLGPSNGKKENANPQGRPGGRGRAPDDGRGRAGR